MFKFFNKIKSKNSAAPPTLGVKDVNHEDIPRYPPFVEGLPVSSVEKIFQTQNELIQRIRSVLGFNDEMYEKHLLPVILNYINFVHLLPASESHHHRGAGGLFRHGLEVGFYAAQFSEGMILANYGTQEQRRNAEPRWRFAAFLTGMHHDDGKPVSDLSITDKTGNLTWLPLSETLIEWANEHKINNYYIRWRNNRHKRHEKMSLQVAQRLIPKETWTYLSEDGNHQIPEMLIDAISGMSTMQPLAKLMLKADQASVEKDLKEFRGSLDTFMYGIPIERYIFDTIRGLINKKKWKVNELGGAVWHTKAGTFLAWKQNIGQFNSEIAELKIPGIPKDADVLADILIERDLAVPKPIPNSESTYRYWQVRLNVNAEDQNIQNTSVRLILLRIESPGLIFSTEPNSICDAIILDNENEQEEDVLEEPEEIISQDANSNDVNKVQAIQESVINNEPKPTEINTLPHNELQAQPVIENPSVKPTISPLAKGKGEDKPKNIMAQSNPAVKQRRLEDLLDSAISKSKVNIAQNDTVLMPDQPKHNKKMAVIKPETANDLSKNIQVIGQESEPLKPIKKPAVIKSAVEPVMPGNYLQSLLSYLEIRHPKSKDLIEKSISLLINRDISLGTILCKRNKDVFIKYPAGAEALGAHFNLSALDTLKTLSQDGSLTKDIVMDRFIVTLDSERVMLLNPALASQILNVLAENEAKMEQLLPPGQQLSNQILPDIPVDNQIDSDIFPGEYESKNNIPKITLEEKLSAKIMTVEEVIDELIAQVDKGSGKWISRFKIAETPEYKIIPMAVLDHIISEHIHISKSNLRFKLSIGNRERYLDNGEIYFKKKVE